MQTAAILTNNKYLYQKLYLLLIDSGYDVTDETNAEIILCDIDSTQKKEGAINISYNKDSGADITLPASFDEIKEKISSGDECMIKTDDSRRMLFIKGTPIKLTEIEYSLFKFLFEKGDFSKRQEILDAVWHGDADVGIVNVYIHYLRQKIELSGEKIIISSRKEGYAISKKYLNRA